MIFVQCSIFLAMASPGAYLVAMVQCSKMR